MLAYEQTTGPITVTLRAMYLDGRSDLMQQRFAFGCHVCIRNAGPGDVQLVRRQLTIRETDGSVQDVDDDGGAAGGSIIPPGGVHETMTPCVIRSFDGEVEGAALLQHPNGARFRAPFPRLPLHAAAN
jgi:ApaG protein